MISKVLAFILQEQKILVFKHRDYPDAGIQVPAGTIDPGESPEEAVVRELFEESGLTNVHIKEKVGVFEHFHTHKAQWHRRHVFLMEATDTLPMVWTHVVSSGSDDKGLVLEYFWLPLEQSNVLEEEQGAYLNTTPSSHLTHAQYSLE